MVRADHSVLCLLHLGDDLRQNEPLLTGREMFLIDQFPWHTFGFGRKKHNLPVDDHELVAPEQCDRLSPTVRQPIRYLAHSLKTDRRHRGRPGIYLLLAQLEFGEID